MELLQRDPRHNTRKDVVSKTKIDVKPFDVETTFAEVTAQKKSRVTKYRGPDSPLYSAVYPVACIMKVFGVAPYDFAGDRLTPSNACIVFSLIFMVIYSYIMYIVYLKFINTTREKSILGVVETTKVVVNYLVMTYELVATIFTRRAFTRVWNDLQDFDENLSALGYPRKERRIGILIWVLMFGLAISWTVINQSGMYAFQETWMFNAAYLLTYIGTSMCVYKFCGMVIFIGQRFHQLNQIAWENLPPIVGYKSSTVSRKTIQDLHDELMLIAEYLNVFSSWSLLFWLGNLSVHSVSNLYFIIDWVILKPWTVITWPLVLNMFAWLLAFIAQLLILHISCDYTITEANSMGAILVQWDARVIQRFPHDDSVRASLHFLSRRLYFSAGGLFEVNLPLLCSIVGVLSTYLIILLQFPA
ncbi:uncharacterized protein LOC143372434 [Andrena cerasifolii]|uniref:uncharacterized protein LOC143372434 n=1 Tax=Andrena cerasifolii TaxID=2819439 RepID=UPI004037AF41